tara:strand:- start:409 stop:1392 length:984 start_codon:yes stop_codon:yes gene_type:complete
MTASRALRNQPNVAPATRDLVFAAAEELDYHMDPHLSRLMSRVRSKKQRPIQAVIAVLREDPPGENFPGQPYRFVPLDFIRERARSHGFEVEEFWLGRDGLTPEKTRRILRARGIEAVIVSPQSEQLPCSQFDYSGFAAATFGFAMSKPSLHTAATNLHLGIQIATEELMARGYRRIGLAVTEWLDSRVQNGYRSGLYLHHQRIREQDRVPLLMFPEKSVAHGFGRFRAWFETHRPDVILSFDRHVPGWLEQRLGLRIPEDMGFVVHDLTDESPRFAGLDHRRDELARAAVDLVTTQLQQFESGVPETPRQILIPPRWVVGPSVRPV